MQEGRQGVYGRDALPFALYAKAVEKTHEYKKASDKILKDYDALASHIKVRTQLSWIDNSKFDAKNEGYITVHSNQVFIHVPFHLTHAFPFVSTLDELVDIAKHIRIGPESIICISGSATCMERLDSIGDIDYCEYAPETDNVFMSEIEKTVLADKESLVCIKVKWGDELKVSRPWNELKNCIDKAKKAIAKNVALSKTNWKLDFVGITQVVGPIAITNMCLPHEEPGSRTARSWIYQEAVIHDESELKGSLSDPIQFGHYILWLIESVLEYKGENPKKAAKRALSLCYLLGFGDEATLIEQALNQEALVHDTRDEALNEVDELLSIDNDVSMNELRIASEHKRKELGGTSTTLDSNKQGALLLCERAIKAAMEAVDKVMKEANEFLELSERVIA